MRRGPGVILVAGLQICGCGKAVDPGDDGEVDAAGDGGGEDAGRDAGDEPDAGMDDQVGLIHVLVQNYTDAENGPVLASTATAQFGDFATEDCIVELPGTDCEVLACTARGTPASFPDAGTIVIEGDIVQPELVLEPEADGTYGRADLEGILFADGEELTAAAAGGEIPKFDLDVDGPYHIGFQGGVPTRTAPIDLSLSVDTELFWAAIELTDLVRIELSTARDGDGARKLLRCSVDAAVERVSLSSTALGYLQPGPLEFDARSETTVDRGVDDFEVALTAAVIMRTGGDASFDRAAGTINLVP